MRAYVIRRILLMVPTLFILTILIFMSVRFIPGDVVDMMMQQMMLSGALLDMDRDAFEHALGLDQPIYVQYADWISGIFVRGTLGESLMHEFTIEERILGRLPVTLELGLLAILIGLVIARCRSASTPPCAATGSPTTPGALGGDHRNCHAPTSGSASW